MDEDLKGSADEAKVDETPTADAADATDGSSESTGE